MRNHVVSPAVVFSTAAASLLISCAGADAPSRESDGSAEGYDGPIALFDGRVIPAMPQLMGMRAQYELRLDWLEMKHAMLLEQMRDHGIEMWIVVRRGVPSGSGHSSMWRQRFTTRADGTSWSSSTPARTGSRATPTTGGPTDDYRRFFEPLPAARKRQRNPEHPHRLAGPLGDVRPRDHRTQHGRQPGPR